MLWTNNKNPELLIFMKSKNCVVIDYGIGNTFSVLNALRIIGANPTFTSDLKLIKNADRIILPGVGSFGKGIEKLQSFGIDEALLEFVQKERPLLGICLGMQLLMDVGYEFGEQKGLGLISGAVNKINIQSKDIKVPLIGWYQTYVDKKNLAINQNKLGEEMNGKCYYFVHSYAVKTNNQENHLAYLNFPNNRIISAICKNNIYGVQFHPERSGKYGLNLISKFVDI